MKSCQVDVQFQIVVMALQKIVVAFVVAMVQLVLMMAVMLVKLKIVWMYVVVPQWLMLVVCVMEMIQAVQTVLARPMEV